MRTYSQGMRQRLAIAQAMLGLPDLLILDEPTNGLDPPQIREMRAVVRRYAAAGRTVLVSSHLLSEVEQSCTHLVVMDKGRLIAAGPVAEITGGGDTLLVGASRHDGSRVGGGSRQGVGAAGRRVGRTGASRRGRTAGAPGRDARTRVAHRTAASRRPVERIGPHRRLEDAFLTLIGGPA